MATPKAERRAPPDDTSALDRLFFAGFLVALLAIAFLAGALLSTAQVAPGPQIARAYEAGRALYTQATAYDDVYSGDLWYPQRSEARGVTQSDRTRAQEGLTLYASGEANRARLLSLDGEVLHEWHLPFSAMLEAGYEFPRPRPDDFVYFRNLHLYPNGDLLTVLEGNGDTPYGYAVAKLNRDSELLWLYTGRAHHDLTVGPDGRIYTLTHEIVRKRLEGFNHLDDAWLEDYLVVLSPEGEEQLKLPLTEAVARSPYRHLIHTVASYSLGDPLHTNAVNLVGPEAAESLPFAEEGDVMLSFRELNAIGVINPEREELVWATRGPWLGQHDADPLPNGNILLFDNYGNYQSDEGISRVMEFDPRSMEIVWDYAGSAEEPLDSAIRAEQQRLENGNTLIVESNGGRILEVTPEGEIVWEYLTPARGGEEEEHIAIVASAERLSPDSFDPDFLATLDLSDTAELAASTSTPLDGREQNHD
ncbi:arylsulfotransferase family protein [Aquibaculum sediminis]|uniref:arylsulfotransferase family protein n=1 Tax=Aquibaculum sediminis TaxID=3231907 RepID=UPI003456CA5B